MKRCLSLLICGCLALGFVASTANAGNFGFGGSKPSGAFGNGNLPSRGNFPVQIGNGLGNNLNRGPFKFPGKVTNRGSLAGPNKTNPPINNPSKPATNNNAAEFERIKTGALINF